MSSTPAKGLFSQAISQSGRWNPFLDRNVSIQGVYPAILEATGCNTTQDEDQQLSCLRSVEAANFATDETVAQVTAQAAPALRAYSQAPTFVASLGPWYPTAGTGIIDGLATSLIAEGSLPSAGIPFMIGTVQDEGVSKPARTYYVSIDRAPHFAKRRSSWPWLRSYRILYQQCRLS